MLAPGLCAILCPIERRRLVAVISYAISNSVGFALLSGSAIRYRFYTAWGLTAWQIGQIIAFCNLSFGLGLFAVGGLVFAVEPLSVPGILHLPFATVHPLGVMFLVHDCGLFDPQQLQSAIAQNQGLGAAPPALTFPWPRLPSLPAIGPWPQRCSMCCCPPTPT
jgi:hypothetical protein